MTIVDSIATLERLVKQADKDRRRFHIELMAYEDVQQDYGKCCLWIKPDERDIYFTAYAEAQLKLAVEGKEE